jgi:hypothetical protein
MPARYAEMPAQAFYISDQRFYIVMRGRSMGKAFACATLVKEKDVVISGIEKTIFVGAMPAGAAVQIYDRIAVRCAIARVMQPMIVARIEQAGLIGRPIGIKACLRHSLRDYSFIRARSRSRSAASAVCQTRLSSTQVGRMPP